jgi:hypothetical protein
MRKWIRMSVSLGTVLGLLIGATAAFADAGLEPLSVEAALHPGESFEIEKIVTTLEIPPIVDICLLEDETGSFADDIGNLQALAGPGGPLITALDATGANYASCVLGFRDFAQRFWGSSSDWVYRQYADVTPGGAGFAAGVPLLSAGGGADGPEAQLEALHYLATPGHAAIDSNGDGDTTDANDTPAGLQPTWRAGSQRIVLLATDASCHVTGDAGGWPGDAGTTSAAVTAGILSSAGITVIGLTPYSIGCVTTLANGTGGSVQATTASGSDIVDAILAGLSELTVDVAMATDCAAPIGVSFDPAIQTVTSGDQAIFTETISIANDALPGEYECRDWAEINGEPLTDPDTGEIIYEYKHITVLDGRMTGGGSVFAQDGTRVTHGFELHCASVLDPNNLQVNWGKGEKFHLESLDTAICSDDPNIDETPPVAGFDTFVGTGTGRYNGVSGATIEFTFTDAGEPGKLVDFAGITITDAGGDVVLTVGGGLDKGNHQAHAE